MHLLYIDVTRQTAKMVNQATDSYFALIHACQCGVLMDNAGSTETERDYQSKRDCEL